MRRALSSMAEAGHVKLVYGPWNKAFLDEVELFPLGAHDDIVDAAAQGFNRRFPGHLVFVRFDDQVVELRLLGLVRRSVRFEIALDLKLRTRID